MPGALCIISAKGATSDKSKGAGLLAHRKE